MISGIVLSQIVYDLILSLSGSNGVSSGPASVGQPVLALLGGYSVDVVHGILSHIVDSIGNFFRTPNSSLGEGNPAGVAEASARERLTIASEVSELRGSLAGDANSEEILRRLDDMIRRNIASVR